MEELSDSELVDLFRKGQERVFNLLVERHKEKIYYLALRMVRNHQDALDISQDTFLKAYKNLKNFKGESTFFAWLYRIACNLCLNFIKREKFQSFLSFGDLTKPLSRPKDSPDFSYERNQLSEAIDEAINHLPPQQRIAFILHHYEGLPHHKIAQLLGKKEGTIKVNYFQAIKKLQKTLQVYA